MKERIYCALMEPYPRFSLMAGRRFQQLPLPVLHRILDFSCTPNINVYI